MHLYSAWPFLWQIVAEDPRVLDGAAEDSAPQYHVENTQTGQSIPRFRRCGGESFVLGYRFCDFCRRGHCVTTELFLVIQGIHPLWSPRHKTWRGILQTAEVHWEQILQE